MKHSGLREGDFTDIQRIILCDPSAGIDHVAHLVMTLPKGGSARSFLREVLRNYPLAVATAREPDASKRAPPLDPQCNLGLSFRGLEQLAVPPHVLGVFRTQSSAFAAGAPLRAAQYLADTGASAAPHWDKRFGLDAAHAVITLHSKSKPKADVDCILEIADRWDVERVDPIYGSQLTPPDGQQGRWTHFEFRDGLSKVRIRGWSHDVGSPPTPHNELGSFVLGYPNQDGFNPWVLSAYPKRMRSFFRNASFGVLRQIQQEEAPFREFVKARADSLRDEQPGLSESDSKDWIKAKMCGRWPDGTRFEPDAADGWHKGAAATPPDDFNYTADPKGYGCPFGAHVRRMNPRGDDIAHRRHRPLIRRGMPYGPSYPQENEESIERGLLGLFFCASVEDQFEHLLGQWGERVPLGSEDTGRAKDPLIGQHDNKSAAFVIRNQAEGDRRLYFDQPFVHTRGTVYAFYPGKAALDRILTEDNGEFWCDKEDDAP